MGSKLGTYHGFAGSINRVVADAEQTGRTLSAVELTVPPRSGPPLHIHASEVELFFVIAGEVTFWIDGKRVTVGEGGTAFVPKNTPHTFANLTDVPARLLAVFSPGGVEGFFEYGDPKVVGTTYPDQGLLAERFADYATRFNLVALGDSPLLG